VDESGNFNGYIDAELPETFTPKVTALHSINAAIAQSGTDVYYIPKLKDFDLDLANYVAKSNDIYKKEHKFAVVSNQYFDSEVSTSEVATNNRTTRALKTLGYDFLLSNEQVNINTSENAISATYKPELTDDSSILMLTAIMDIYKALGQYERDMKIVFNKDPTLAVSSSPISQYLSVLMKDGNSIDTSEGKAWVWMSVSNPELYRTKAINDKIINSNVTIITGEESKVTTTLNYSDLYKNITLGEFCSVLKNLMDLYGETVMTNDEEKILLQVYGKYIPYYLDESQLDSVKYLLAKGILNPDKEGGYDYLAPLTLDDMLDILMAVKDKDSRYTYKDVQITLDSKLADLGYYETSVVGDVNPVNNVAQDYDVSASNTFDYLVKAKNGYTNFYGNGTNGSEKGKLYYSDLGLLGSKYVSGTSENTKNIIQYMGITPQGYYWFKITTSKTELSKYGLIDSSNYLTITCGESSKSNPTATSKIQYYKMKYGGGVYSPTQSKTLSGKSFDDSNYDSQYVDSIRKGAAQVSSIYGRTYLAANSGITITFTLNATTYKSDVTKITFDGIALTSLGTTGKWEQNGYTISLYKKDIYRGQIVFKVSGCTDLADFRGHVKHPNLDNKYKTYQTFCQSGSNVLVNFDYLQDMGIARGIVDLGDDRILLTTDHNNIYLCQKEGVIIVGNTVYPAAPNSIMYYEKDGQKFVDYRAVQGWSSDYYVFQNTDGTITMSLSNKATNNEIGDRPILMPYGTYNSNSTTYQGTNSSSLKVQYYSSLTSKTEGILLTSLFPTANYMVYIGDDEYGRTGTNQDYLFVFKLKGVKINGEKVSYTNDEKARSLLRENIGYDAPKSWLVYVYPIYHEETSTQHNPPNLHYNKDVGYYYTPQSDVSNILDKYYASCTTKADGTGKLRFKTGYTNQIVLPFISNNKYNSFIYNINFNTFNYKATSFSYGVAPAPFLFKSTKDNKNKVAKWSPDYTSSSILDKSYTDLMDNLVMNPAPTGVISSLLNLGNKTIDEIKNTTPILYYGTVRVKLVPSTLSLKAAEKSFTSLIDNDKVVCRILRSTVGGYIYGIMGEDMSLISGSDSIIDQAEKPDISSGLSLPKFDFGKFKFGNLLQNAEDWITIATIFALNIIPRIAVGIFMILIGLSLVTNVKPWVRFCDNVFDLYKLLTFKRKDVHTIDTYLMFFSSILGIAVFGLFMDGTVIELYSWAARAISGILTR
jgi:hypothetical protein